MSTDHNDTGNEDVLSDESEDLSSDVSFNIDFLDDISAFNESSYSINSMIDNKDTESVRFENEEFNKLREDDLRMLVTDMPLPLGLRDAHCNQQEHDKVVDTVERLAASFHKFKTIYGQID